MSNNSVSRRSFLKGTTATAAVALTHGGITKVLAQQSTELKPGPGNKWPGRVVINFNKNVVTWKGSAANAVPEVIKTMIDESILFLTEKESVGEAWKAIFPNNLTAKSKIAIKVPLGCAKQKIAPHWAATKAIIDGLQQMDFNGTRFPAENIIVYDMRCNNNLNSFGYTTQNLGNVKIVYDRMGSGYNDGAISNNRNLQYATSLKEADFLINLFRPGGHGSYVEGFTLGFKNHYGTYDTDHSASSAPGYLRDINCTGAVYNKNVLSVCYGIFGAAENSGRPDSSDVPYFNYAKSIDSTITNTNHPPCTIIMSTDPITAEMQTIKMMRQRENPPKSFDVNSMPKYLKASGGISGALNPTYNIGIIDEAEMNIRQIINGEKIGVKVKDSKTPFATFSSRLNIHQIRGQHSTIIHYSLPGSKTGSKVKLDIFDLKGSLLRSLSGFVAGTVNNVSWDEKDSAGKLVNNGTYILRLTSANINLSERFTIIR